MSGEHDFDTVESGDMIRFCVPAGINGEGTELTGGVGEVSDGVAAVKAGAWYHIKAEDFIEIVEKGKYL